MNILMNPNNQLTNDILSLLKSMNLEPAWMNKAEQFFDFSQEINFSLLNGTRIHSLELWNSAVSAKAKKIVSDIRQKNDFRYSDRYILFMDAINVTEFMVYRYFDFRFSMELTDTDPCYHAFSLVCADDFQTKARLYANTVSDISYYNGLGFDLYQQEKWAEENPRFIYQAGQYRNPLGFYTLALCYAHKDGKDIFSEAEISEMTDYLAQELKSANLTEERQYQFFMSILFIARKDSSHLREKMLDNIRGREEDFLAGIVRNMPQSYFLSEIPDLLSLMKEYVDIDHIIKFSVFAAYDANAFQENGIAEQTGRDRSQNALALLAYEAKHYPDEYYAVMHSRDKMTGIHHMGYVPDYYYVFYDQLFDILAKENPQAAHRLSADRYGDMTEFFTQIEQDASVAREEVGQYLRGEQDISVLLPQHDRIADPSRHTPFTSYHVRLILYALRKIPDYRDRYIAYKTIQEPYNINNYAGDIIRAMRIGKTDTEEEFDALIDSLVQENVPLEDRFGLYQDMDNSWFYGESPERTRLFETYVDKMMSLSATHDTIYEALADIKNVYARRLYALYLHKTGIAMGQHRKILLKMCGDGSKEVRREIIAAVTAHKGLESDIKDLLTAKKQAVRETAVEILNNWGAANYTELLTTAAENEKSTKVADRIREILAQTGVGISAANTDDTETAFSADTYIKTMLKGGRVKKIQWLYEMPLPAVHLTDGTLTDDSYCQAMLLSYTPLSAPERPAEADQLADHLNKKDLSAFAAEVFARWYHAGAESKRKQLMYFAAAYGDSALIDEMLRCIKEWASPEKARGAIAAETAKALALNGSSQALMAVDSMARKFKHKQVRAAATEAMNKAAQILGLTAEELGDRIIPDLGFDSEKKQVFDYGTRKFIVYLTSALTLEVTDENGKKVKSLPSPGKRDDEEKASAAYESYKQLKKQLKTVVSIQAARLETALISDRRWRKADWEKLFVQNPVMHSFAEGLIWAAYQDSECAGTFRYMEDGTFNTADSDEFDLPDNSTIGLVHPLELDEETLSAWKEQLSDYEITQPFMQLERPVFRINENEKGTLDVTRFAGRTLSAYSIIGRTEKAGWYKGSIQDGGGFFEFYREDITAREKQPDGTVKLSGYAAEFTFSGCSVGYYEEDVTIENLRFYHPGTVERGSYVYDKADDNKAIPLDQVNPRYFSEILYQMEQITKTG